MATANSTFDGAVRGFFVGFSRVFRGFFADRPDRPATFDAYHALPEHQGSWVSTGVSAPVGVAKMEPESIDFEIDLIGGGARHGKCVGEWVPAGASLRWRG